MTEIDSFLTDVRIALCLHPMQNPNVTVRNCCSAMLAHDLYVGTDCDMHVKGGASHSRPYDVLKPGIKMHQEMVG